MGAESKPNKYRGGVVTKTRTTVRAISPARPIITNPTVQFPRLKAKRLAKIMGKKTKGNNTCSGRRLLTTMANSTNPTPAKKGRDVVHRINPNSTKMNRILANTEHRCSQQPWLTAKLSKVARFINPSLPGKPAALYFIHIPHHKQAYYQFHRHP